MLKDYRNNMVSGQSKNVFRSVTMDSLNLNEYTGHHLLQRSQVMHWSLCLAWEEYTEEKTIFLLRGLACQGQTIILVYSFVQLKYYPCLQATFRYKVSSSASVTIYQVHF